jgi:tRNA uridine 5-carboxymethylaminomethyl modification enzyme
MFTGRIEGTGPRYCPSIEDKIERFSQRDRHQIFVEPEGRNTIEVYVNGFSTSLPEEVQQKALRSIVGFENAKMFRPGYAIEYDFFPPTQLKNTLETNRIENLYFAGQINGTTGYEEAAAQGLMAGINAHQKNNNKDPFILLRNQAYIGVLIDDLITKGTEEPYRMFTSRAEYRLLLRQDNADERLTKLSYDIGLASEDRLLKMQTKYKEVNKLSRFIEKTSAEPMQVNDLFDKLGSAKIKQKTRIKNLLSRPQINFPNLIQSISSLEAQIDTIEEDRQEIIESVEIKTKYAGYIMKEKEMAEKIIRLDKVSIPSTMDFNSMVALSSEARDKFTKQRPETLGQASRISGVSPADVSILLVHLGR